MANILALETATRNCSVAIFDDDRLIAIKEEGGAYSHAEKLQVFIDEALKQAGISPKKLDAVAISEGPGSYTGLRIGTSTAKGICYAMNKPLLSISTLHTMAAGALDFLSKQPDGLSNVEALCPMIDARRMEVYAAIFDPDLRLLRPIAADIIEESDQYAAYCKKGSLYYFGDGAGKCRELFEKQPGLEFLQTDQPLPSARHMGTLAVEKYTNKTWENTAYFEPFYLKEFMTTRPKKLL